MIRALIRCHEMVEIVTDWMESALDFDERAAADAHLAACPDCTAYVNQLRTATALAAGLDAHRPVPHETETRLLAAFRARRPG
jgi:anti-sigma factor RsiW